MPAMTAESLLGLKPTTPIAMHDAIANGLACSALGKFVERSGLPSAEVQAVLGMRPRTLPRRQAGGRLTMEESGRLHRLAQLFEQARELFDGDAPTATKWLLLERPTLGGRRPIDLASTPVGAQQVEALLWKLDHGVVV